MGGACSSSSTDESATSKQKQNQRGGKQAGKGGTSQCLSVHEICKHPPLSFIIQQQRRSTRKGQSTPRDPVNEKGYKKRIRENLRQATKRSDIEELENAIHNFEKNKLEDNGDLADAKERLHFLNLRKDLRDAILRRHPGILDTAINNVECSDYRSELSQQLETAKRLREHLTELDCYRHDILEMDQSTISEIRSYHHPPDGVHEVMMGTYLLLGYDEDKLRDWVDVQCLLGRYGRESLIREIRNADTVNIDDMVCRHVAKLQSKTSPEKIREVSNGAATFYVWNEKMVNKATKDRQTQNQPSQATTPKGKQKQKGNTEKPRPKNQG
ncbi:hypothetical protein FSP39_005809 [Pinctada imbricata]|uniref:Uncharacterized protein n=1 Tax=Pinctada imbricata TaxID=66713 RepID=A0AA88Y3E5_PINIB|nr:hypothetical protein FSP39_005809 [Pinctada imbricata]